MPQSGDIIGPYTLVRELGSGAFGVVWLAERRSSLVTTQFALKLPKKEDVELEVIRREADVWVKASGHSNVLPIIEAEVYGGHIVIASEYAPDGSLKTWLVRYDGKAPSSDSAVEMMSGILAGLHHLHARRIVHRDLKPDNILLLGETPRIADFGLARVLKSSASSRGVAGTLPYMAPEAFDGERSEQTDVWSAGVIFYQLLSGRLPFPQREMAALVGAITRYDPPPLPPSVPSALAEVVERALQKDPAKRYKSAAEMRQALRDRAKPPVTVAPTDEETRPAPTASTITTEALPPTEKAPSPATVLHLAPLGVNIPSETPASSLPLPPGYRYLGKLDGLTTDHLYREQDSHVALWFPAQPGVSSPFIIDKYAVTAQQFSYCLNDLADQGLVRTARQGAGGTLCCVDWRGRSLVLDALERWRLGPPAREPWLNAADPWGLTYQDNAWRPVPGCELLPAAMVTWWGARAYGLWCHRLPVESSDESGACLPSADQWRLAALFDPQTKSNRPFPWGERWERGLVNYAGYWADREVGGETDWQRWWAARPEVYGRTRPLPVFALPEGRSPVGCTQMVGNTWEWCADAPADDSGRRTIKGGACNSSQADCAPDSSKSWRAELGSAYIGFRCALSIPGGG